MPNPQNLARNTIIASLLIIFSNSIFEPSLENKRSNSLMAAPVESISNAGEDNFSSRIALRNLGGLPGTAVIESTGSLTLTWTAPGDDADSGRADHYIIRYSADSLFDSNWEWASFAPNPPLPLDAGSEQSYIMSGLENGRRYFVGIKTSDDAGNISPLSNIAAVFASGLQAPTLVGAEIDTVNNGVALYANPIESGIPVFYEFQLDTTSSFSNPAVDVDLIIDSLVSVTFAQLQIEIPYFWRCRAVASDRSDSSSWSVIDSFLIYIEDAVSPVVQVISPNGGEDWLAGSLQYINWNASDNVAVESCRVDFTSNGGADWQVVRSWGPDIDSLTWIVPAQISQLCLVRIIALDAAGNVGFDISNSFFTISSDLPLTVVLTSPDGRERWDVFSQQSVTWTDSNDVQIESYKLEYSTNAGADWTMICEWADGDPRDVPWTLPDTPSRRARVKVSCRDIDGDSSSDISNHNFTIRDISRPRVNLLFPDGGDSLEVGFDTLIVWDASDNMGIDSFMIEFTLNGGAEWDTIVAWQSGNPGQFEWNIPNLPNSQCFLRMSCRDEYDNIASDTSSAFTILDTRAPTVFIADPIPIGDSLRIGWSAFDNGMIARYVIDYSTDDGQSWVEYISGEGGDSGSVTFPPREIETASLVRVSCFDLAQNRGSDTISISPTSVDDSDGAAPTIYFLSQSYPNPFNPSATIEYGLPVSSHVTIEIFDITGARVTLLKDEYQEAGNHKIIWNARNVTSGAYFYRIAAGEFNEVGRAMLVK